MQETSHAFFILDDHPSGAALPAGPVRLKGWAVAKPECFFTDLRIRTGDRTFPGFYGLPRPDLAAYFKAREPFLLAGYEVDVTLAPGDNRLQFEVCDVSGLWLPLAEVVFTGTAGEAPPPPPADTIPAHEFARALRLVLQHAAIGPLPKAAAAVAALLPQPHVTRFPALPFHGHLHHPPRLQRTEFGRVIVEGWLFHETAQIRRVAATVDLQAWQILDHDGELPYVAGLFPQFPQAAKCRIHGSIDVPAQLPQPLSLRVYAELADGSWHLCQVERCHLYGDEQDKAPYVPFSTVTFARCGRALTHACEQLGFVVPRDKWFFRALREVWQEYRLRAPRLVWWQSVSAPPFRPAGKLPGSVTLVTHNLNFEGAPLFLLEYAAHLAGQGVRLAVVSAGEGPLRPRFEGLGARVDVIDVSPLLKADSARALRAALRHLAPQVDLAGAGLVVVNTLSAYWGVHLAAQARRPSIFYLHESTTPDTFFFGYMAAATLPVVKQTFALATHVSFLTDATRRYYEALLVRSNHSINPGWIDLARLDRYRAENSREKLRARLGLTPGTRLVVNIGSVCNRKGQHIFARAVDLLWRRQPALAARCEFLMVGGRTTAFDRAIAGLLGQLDRANLRVIAETPEPYEYYGAADLFVCSSYEESFPRVVLEAMAFGLPIVSTDVHGIPEMARPGREAVLVPAGDSASLAGALARVLVDENFAQVLAAAARERVVAQFDSRTLLPRHSQLASAVAAGPL